MSDENAKQGKILGNDDLVLVLQMINYNDSQTASKGSQRLVDAIYSPEVSPEVNNLCLDFYSRQPDGFHSMKKLFYYGPNEINKDVMVNLIKASLKKSPELTVEIFVRCHPEIQKLFIPQIIERQIALITQSPFKFDMSILTEEMQKIYLGTFSEELLNSLIPADPPDSSSR